MVFLKRIILGSTSQFRAELLRQTGISFDSIGSSADEALIEHPLPSTLALLRAEAKALGVVVSEFPCLVIGSDQVVEFQGQAFGKVQTRREAFDRLSLISGKTHFLHSAYAIYVMQSGTEHVKYVSRVVTAKIKVRKLNAEEIESYLDFGEWKGSSACYHYEGRGIHLFEHVEGDYSTIIGLPLKDLLCDFRKLGINGINNPDGPWNVLL